MEVASTYGPLIDTRLRVMTWNVWHRFGPWEERLPAIAATLRAAHPDVVCLQEVWSETGDGRDEAAELAAELGGYHHAYGSRLEYDGVCFGNAVLSRWPITGSEVEPLPAPADADELRTVVRADIDGPRGPLQVFSTHLNWRFDQSAVRVEQVRAVCAFVDRSPARGYPAIVGGDFNAVPESDEIRMMTGKAPVPVAKLVFHDAWDAAGAAAEGPGVTWDNRNSFARLDLEPDRRIDYVFVGWPKAGGAGNVVAAEVVGLDPVDGIVPSDHLAVVADLRY